jgi:hypothetical protein
MPFGVFYLQLLYFVFFGICFKILVCCTKKNLATLLLSEDIAPLLLTSFSLGTFAATQMRAAQ